MKGISVNSQGCLMIGSCSTLELAKIYKTPLYVMDEEVIRGNCRFFVGTMKEFYGENFNVIYASKAFMCKEICKIVESEGLNIDVVSSGELYTAVKAGFNSKKIYFHGNNKTYDELKLAISSEVGIIVIDNKYEAEMISDIAVNLGKEVNVLVRIKPGVEAHTHSFIKTGQIDSKFGFAIENGEALDIVLKLKNTKAINFKGIHCHIGSQIIGVEPFVRAAEVMLEFVNVLSKKFNVKVDELNLGGGFGIKYLDSDFPLNCRECIEKVSKTIKNKCDEFSIKTPKISIEPGRSIVGEAGLTLYKVGNIKEIKNVRTYVSIDGGMTDNPRYILYGSKYEVVNAGKMREKKEKVVTIAGKCCESGDLIQKDVNICNSEVGDVLAVLSTGAYNYSMASNYNRIPKAAVVMVKNGEHRLIVKRQTLDDIVKQDI